jgi:DNA-binding NtrC family response regulator
MLEAFFSAAIKFTWNKTVGLACRKFFKKKALTIEEIKKKTQILFVDDESFDHLTVAIRDAGWNVRQINDITNIHNEEIKNADIIFMDFKGVGVKLTPTKEGIGLMAHLRKNYPKKHIIFYSGSAGFVPGYEVMGIANEWIQKSADPFEYLDRIEAAAHSIYG